MSYTRIQEASAARELLVLKHKASTGLSWTQADVTAVNGWLAVGGPISVLAACCVLSTPHEGDHEMSLSILRAALRDCHPAPMVETAIYEALIYLDAFELRHLGAEILHFVKQSVTRGFSDLDNALYVVEKLTQQGNVEAVEVLRSLTSVSDSRVRDRAATLLKKI